ncbi:unnamed protein product [Rotaria socialis]|uniref:Uncharacterized protein n=1 Tax=Rotaria socialis TaxID=392032 RepID=A0A817YAQ8_9BILA|nr:unnamed protein product [Rotaria socialis]CAF3489643.1 unnamed protein product [Rotaria socialis]CAF4321601.1 unnamed protein product [Rotaria socialis]CAF4851373.1 unnamed protein product [Rotaria socialis]
MLFCILLILNLSWTTAIATELDQLLPSIPVSSQIKRLASRCYINDYPAWLERQQELMIWFHLAKLLKLPIEENKVIQEELEQIRLQHECLRFIEHLTLSIGPG